MNWQNSAGIYSDRLKLGADDNFFDLGINSLMAVKIMVRVEKQFGKRLPLSVLFQYPNVKELAAVIDDPSLHASYKTLVPIKPKGNKIPVYIVHGIGLNLLNVYNMAFYLDPEQPVYGVQSIGLDGTMKVPDTLEAIAAFYNEEIIKNDPRRALRCGRLLVRWVYCLRDG